VNSDLQKEDIKVQRRNQEVKKASCTGEEGVEKEIHRSREGMLKAHPLFCRKNPMN